MKVGIDASALERDFSGIEVYVKKLIDGLASENTALELYSYASLSKHYFHSLLKSSEYSNPGKLKKIFWNQVGISKLVSGEVNIFHSPAFSLPLFLDRKIRKIVTVHDFAFLKFPEFFKFSEKMYYKLVLDHSLKKADKIICISQNSQNDLDFYYPKYSRKSVVVYNGYEDFSKVDQDSTFLTNQKIQKGNFLLTVGTLNPRKNLTNVIKSFNLLQKIYPELQLVIVGKDGEKIKKEWDINNESIVFTGYIGQAELASLYQNARAFIFLSFYEGFGFPILEAMGCGLPLILSNSPSTKEISGLPGTLLCNPTDVDDIVEKCIFAIEPNSRDFYFEHGEKIRHNFSWSKMVKETLDVYKSL
jgi:glycosyltransferase involved in cell wall biosynthesis